MADIRLTIDEARFCIKGAQLILHGVRRDLAGQIIDHVDLTLPWSLQRTIQGIRNLDGIHYPVGDETNNDHRT